MPKQTRKLTSLAVYLISCAFALFGLLNSHSKIDVLHLSLFSFLITYLLYSNNDTKIKTLWIIWIITLLVALFANILYYPNLFILAATSILGGIIYFFILRKIAINFNNIFVIHLIAFFLISAFFNSVNLRKTIAQEPSPKSYFNDYLGFLRNFYLVENGYSYYDGLVKTHTDDGRSSTIPSKVWNWRLPTYAYLWLIFPGYGGISVYIFFLALSSIALYFTYQIGKVFLDSSHANLVPYVLLPYFHFGARDLSFLEMEWWALSFLILAIFAIFKNRPNLLFISAVLTILLRELFVIPILLWILMMIISRRYRLAKALIFAVITFLVAFSLHYLRVTEYISRSLDSIIFGSRSFDLAVFQQTLSYGSVDYLSFRLRPFLVSLVISALLFTVCIYKKRLNFNLLIMPLAAFSMAIFALKFAVKDADYWGVSYIPLHLISFAILSIKIVSGDERT